MSSCYGNIYSASPSDPVLHLAARQESHGQSTPDHFGYDNTHSRHCCSRNTNTGQLRPITTEERRVRLISIIDQALKLAESVDFADVENADEPKW